MRRVHLSVAIVGVVLTLGGFIWFGTNVGVSVGMGGAIAAINLHVLAKAVRRLVEGQNASWAGVALVKFLVLLAATYGLLESGWVTPLGLVVGFSALPLGIVLTGISGTAAPVSAHAKSDHA